MSFFHNTSLFFRLLLGAQILVVLAILAMGLSSRLQSKWMDNMHLTNSSFPEWALLQIVPKMYNFENDVLITAFDPQDELLFDSRFHVNHYPPSLLSFSIYPTITRIQGIRFHLTARSLYRDQCQQRSLLMERINDAVVMTPTPPHRLDHPSPPPECPP